MIFLVRTITKDLHFYEINKDVNVITHGEVFDQVGVNLE